MLLVEPVSEQGIKIKNEGETWIKMQGSECSTGYSFCRPLGGDICL